MAKPLPEKKDASRASGCFGIAFALCGLLFLLFFLWQAYTDVCCFTLYRPATCTVLSKELLETSGDDGPTYRPEVEFEFATDDGRTVRTKGFENWKISGGRAGRQHELDQFEVGKSYPCWYDPGDPRQAVLVRRISWLYLFALIPLLFFVIGVSVLWNSRKGIGRGLSPEARLRQAQIRGQTAAKPLQTRPGSVLPVALGREKSNTPGVGCLIFSMLLLGAGGAVYSKWASSLWGLALALGVVGLIGAVVSFFSLGTRKRIRQIEVEASAAELIPGQDLECFVRLIGQTELNGVTVRLVCEERATYQQGTDTRTEKRKVLEETIAEQTLIQLSPLEPLELRGRVRIPLNAMHSFKSEHNEIAWFIQVNCDIPHWPDSETRYPLTIAARWTSGGTGDTAT